MAKKRDDYSILRGRIVLIIFSAYGLALVVFFAYALFTFPEKYYLSPFRLNWTFIQTAINFIENLIPVHCAAVLFACSLFAPPFPSLNSGIKETFGRLISSTVAVFIIGGLLYVTLAEGFLPLLHRNLNGLETRTTVARSYLELSERARTTGDNQLRKAYLEYYLTIDPGNTTAAEALANLRLHGSGSAGMEGDAGARLRGAPPRKQARLLDLDTDELFRRAEASLEKEDYYTAYYFADLALALSPRGSSEWQMAEAMTQKIQIQLNSYKADAEENTRKALFEIKTQAHSDLSSDETALIVRAYYTFLHLTKRDPTDREAAKYLAESTRKLETVAFFRDEIERFGAMPGINRLFFVNNEEASDHTQIVAIGGIITTENGIYARDIEVISIGPDGMVTCRYSAQAGKIMNDKEGRRAVFMFGVDRQESTNTLFPAVHQGDCEGILRIVPPLDDLRLLGTGGRNIESHHLTTLWGMWEITSPRGYPSDVIQIAALMRVATAFGFIVLSLFSLSLGWKLKPSGSSPIFAGVILIPILPVAAYFIFELYEYLQTLIIGSALLAWGFTPALIVVIALQFILIVISISILAAQSLRIHESRSA